MPAAVETAVFANKPAWHRIGTTLDTEGAKGITVPVALEASGIDWEVQKAPALTFGLDSSIKSYKDFMEKVKSGATLKYSDLVWIQGQHAVQRQTDGRAFGVVGNTWQPVQNAAGFEIVQDVIELAGGQCWIEAAGALDGGARVWILAHIDAGMQIAGEDIATYLLFYNGHNGRAAVTAACVDMRVVCANTLQVGLWQAKQSGRIVRVRHTTKAAERIKEAAHIIGLRNVRNEEMAKQGEWLVEQSWDEGAFENFLETLMPIPEGQEGKPAETMIEGRRSEVRSIYHNAENLQQIRGTAWGGFNSVVEYLDHAREFKSDESAFKAQLGLNPVPLKQRAFDLAMGLSLN